MKNDLLEKIYESKKKYHRDMAKIPFEEKLLILENLNRLTYDMKNAEILPEEEEGD